MIGSIAVTASSADSHWSVSSLKSAFKLIVILPVFVSSLYSTVKLNLISKSSPSSVVSNKPLKTLFSILPYFSLSTDHVIVAWPSFSTVTVPGNVTVAP